MSRIRVGSKVDRYVVDAVLGTGGMGSVFRARHEVLGTEVALKVLASNLADNPKVRERFRQEAYVRAQLQHPNIIRVADFIDTDEYTAFVMELGNGPSLREYLDTHPGGLSWQQAKPILEGICAGVGFAHARGVLHRDIKPANVLLVEQDSALVSRVTDFGLARLLSGKGMTRTGTQMGTPGYMAPELIRGDKDPTAAIDVYALGALAYVMLSGRMTFEGDSEYGVISQVMQGAPPPALHELKPEIPRALSDAVMAALAFAPEDRPADANVFGAMLKSGSHETTEPTHSGDGESKSAVAESQSSAAATSEPEVGVQPDSPATVATKNTQATNMPPAASSEGGRTWLWIGGALVGLLAISGAFYFGKSQGGTLPARSIFDSPWAVGKAFVEAVNSGDSKKLAALFPSEALIKEAMTCEDAKDNLTTKVAKELGKLTKQLEGDLKGIKLGWKSSESRETKAVKKGEKLGSCTFNMDTELAEVKWKFTMSKDGKSEDESEGVAVIKLGDKGWFLVDM